MGKRDPELPPDSLEAKALAEVAAKRFNRYQQIFVPLENAYIKDVMNVRSRGAYETVGGLASAEYAANFDAANRQFASEMAQQGVDPNSGVFIGNSASLRKAQAVRQGIGVAGAKVENTNRFYEGLSSIINMGQGQSAEAIGGMASIANLAEQRALDDASRSFERASAMRAGVGTMVGLGVSPFVDRALNKDRKNRGG